MAWALIDDNFPKHPKVLQAIQQHALARDLFVCGVCYCRKHFTEGFIPDAALKFLGLTTNPKKPADALVAAGLWIRTENGYQVHDYAATYDDVDAKAQRAERREQRRIAGKKGGKASWAAREASGNLGICASKQNEAETKQPASLSAEAHRSGVVRSGSVVTPALEKKKEIGARDEWWHELLRRYPESRVQRGRVVQDLFNDVFREDSRPDEQVWSDMLVSLETAIRGEQWSVKGMVPKLENWLVNGNCFQKHEPVKAHGTSSKTAGNAEAARRFLERREA